MWAKAGKRQFEAWYKRYVKLWHPELAMVEIRVLSRVISAFSCELNRSAHGHIHSNIRNRLEPAAVQPLKSLYMFTQTAKWWQLLAMLTNSRCLLGLCI